MGVRVELRQVRTVLGGVLELVQGKGYEQWFLISAFLHPIAWLMLWGFRVHRGGEDQVVPKA
jgi:hypothetical protein